MQIYDTKYSKVLRICCWVLGRRAAPFCAGWVTLDCCTTASLAGVEGAGGGPPRVTPSRDGSLRRQLKKFINLKRAMTKKRSSVFYLGKIWAIPSVAAPGDTNPSDATVAVNYSEVRNAVLHTAGTIRAFGPPQPAAPGSLGTRLWLMETMQKAGNVSGVVQK